jgi:PAS domain S-box-containing protein
MAKGVCGRLEDSVAGSDDDLEGACNGPAGTGRAAADTAAYLENILANIQCGVIAVDSHGRIVLMNGAAESLTGFSADEARGHGYLGLVGAGIREEATPVYTLATGSPLHQQEKLITAKSGETIPVSFSTAVLIDRDNRVVGAIEVLTDLRKIKQLEEEVSRVRRLAAVGEVAAAVAHEVRNPLGGMKGFASLLERDLAGNEECLALVGKIKEGIASLESIASDLLEAGKPISLERRRIDLVPHIRRVIEIFRMASAGEGKKVIFRLEPPEGPFYCKAEPERIRQAVTNLVANAVEAVGNEGSVTIELYAAPCAGGKPREHPGDSPGRERACIAVSDSGPGMTEEVEEMMFAPFFTTRESGTGLGLHLARKIANLHGGEIRYSRDQGSGGKFIIEIPRW